MSFLHRFVAVLSGLLLLQLMLGGSGSTYVMQHAGTHSGAFGHEVAIAGMMHETSSRASAAPSADDSSVPMGHLDCNSRGDHGGCRQPLAPGQCSTMTTCGVSAKPAANAVTSMYVHVATLEPSSPALVHSGPTFAPELPPPRA